MGGIEKKEKKGKRKTKKEKRKKRRLSNGCLLYVYGRRII